jgi:hypothetical protein
MTRDDDVRPRDVTNFPIRQRNDNLQEKSCIKDPRGTT